MTEESNPLFLYTCDIGETEFHTIRQDQKVRVEFHKLAGYLGELLNLCVDSFNGYNSNSYHTCILSTDRSNVGKFIIEESTQFKDITLISLNFIAAEEQAKLQFLSKQVKDFKNLTAKLTEERDKKTNELENLSKQHQQMGKSYIYIINYF